MDLVNVELARTGDGISGGEVCFIEINRRVAAKQTNILPVRDVSTLRGFGLVGEFVPFQDRVSRSLGVAATYALRAIGAIPFSNHFSTTADAIVSHSEFLPTFICAMLIARRTRKPWIAWLHMLAPNPLLGYRNQFSRDRRPRLPTMNGLFYWLNQRLFLWFARRFASRLIVTAAYTLHRLQPAFGKRVALVPYGITPRQITALPEKKDFDAVFVGRFHPQKGLDYLLDAWRQLADVKPDAVLAIIGSGSPQVERQIQDRIHELGLERNVQSLGFLSGRSKDEVLARSRVFAFPSTYESFGIVALEAMQIGLPVVGFDLPVYDGVFDAMIRVPFGDTAEFAKKLLQLLLDDEFLRSMSQASMRNATRFTWDESTRRYTEVLTGAIND